MKIKNIKDVDGFFKVIDSCAGKVELITGEGDRLNLKSKLCQYGERRSTEMIAQAVVSFLLHRKLLPM